MRRTNCAQPLLNRKEVITLLLQQLINGLSVGSVYALIAVGYALIYSVLNFTNFAHSITVTIGTYGVFWFLTLVSRNLYVGIAVGVLSAIIIGIVIDRFAYHPLLQRKAKRTYLMIVGLGISVMGENLIVIAFTGRIRAYPINFTTGTINLLGNNVGVMDLIILSVSLVALLVVELIIRKTRLGLAVRSASFDLETTSLMGVNALRLILYVFIIAGSLAGIAGALLGSKYTVFPTLGSFFTNKAFIASVVGGLGSLPGAILGALLLGVSEALVSAYISTSFRDLFAYLLLVVILLVKPSGLLGKSSEDKA